MRASLAQGSARTRPQITCYEAVYHQSPQQILLRRVVNGTATLRDMERSRRLRIAALEVSGVGSTVNPVKVGWFRNGPDAGRLQTTARRKESYPEARPVLERMPSVQPPPAQRPSKAQTRLPQWQRPSRYPPHERRHWRCIDKLHRDGKRGCFLEVAITPATTGTSERSPVFSDDCKRHNFDNLSPIRRRVRVGEHQYHERRRP